MIKIKQQFLYKFLVVMVVIFFNGMIPCKICSGDDTSSRDTVIQNSKTPNNKEDELFFDFGLKSKKDIANYCLKQQMSNINLQSKNTVLQNNYSQVSETNNQLNDRIRKLNAYLDKSQRYNYWLMGLNTFLVISVAACGVYLQVYNTWSNTNVTCLYPD